MQRIAILSLTRFGDLIQSIPLLKRIRRQNPNSKITLIVMEEFLGAAKLIRQADEVVGIHLESLIKELDLAQGNLSSAHIHLNAILNQKPLCDSDLLINLSHTPRSATLSSLLGAKQMVGLCRNANGLLRADNPWQVYLFSIMRDRYLNPFNLVEIYGRLFDGERAIEPMTLSIERCDRESADSLLSEHSITKPFIVMHPGTSHIARCWPVNRFVELANRLAYHGFQIVLTGSANERPLTDSIAKQLCNCVSMAGETSISILAAVLSRATCVVSGDTGTIHLASAVGTRTVGIYLGPASSKDTGPYGNNHIVIEADLNCAPCAYNESCSVPACQNKVEASHVLPFILKESTAMSEHESAGVRIFRSEVALNGDYNLKLLNHPRTVADSNLLSAYRSFWKLFLSGETSDLSENSKFVLTREWQTGLRELSAICSDAESAIRLESGDRADLLKWQNNLGTLAVKYCSLTPFVQYIQTQFAFARTAIPNLYFQDLKDTVALSKHGVMLLELCTAKNKTNIRAREVSA